MAYCRWGSGSDVYAFASANGGFVIPDDAIAELDAEAAAAA